VSEAVDFAEFYPQARRCLLPDAQPALPRQGSRCRGLALELPHCHPLRWHHGRLGRRQHRDLQAVFRRYPGRLAALQCFWRAGVSQNTLQFLPCEGGSTGARLTGHPDVNFIILTGGTETGLRILQERPEVLLVAETGGKNATIVTL